MATKFFTKEFAGMLPNIFKVQNEFMRAFGGTLQVKDGVKDTDTFLYIKTNDADVVIQKYNTGANVAFGTGTGNSSRFGPRNEIKAVDTQVPYKDALAIHEGVDAVTVNDDIDGTVAERLEKGAIAWATELNGVLAQELSKGASHTFEGQLTAESLSEVFGKARARMLNNKVNKSIQKIAYVTPEVYDLLVTSNLTTTAKNSSANIDNGELRAFKGFVLIELADDNFQEGEQIIFTVDNVGIAGLGLSMTRAIDSEDFYGVAIQSVAKHGVYLPDKNKKAIFKAKLTEALEA